MAAIRGVTVPTISASTLAWPDGTAAGDLAVLWDVDGVRPSGWSSITGETLAWAKRLTADDITDPLPVRGPVSALFTMSEAGGVGRVRDSEWCRIQAGGVGIWLGWKTPWSSAALASDTYQYGDTVIDPYDQWRHAVWARAVTSTGYYSPGDVHDRTGMVSIEILPVAAPLAPVWVSPASGTAVDRASATALTVAHQSAANMDMEGVKVVIRPAAGAWGSLKADGTIQADTLSELVQDHGQVTIAANVLTANTVYELVPYTRDAGGWSPAGPSLSLTARTVPTLVVTFTTAPGDLTPSGSWVMTPGVGTQTSWEARIAPAGAGPDAAVEAWQSGQNAGTETSWTAPATDQVDNGGDYEMWVRGTDGALRSAWTASSAETVSWTEPDAPTSVTALNTSPLTVTATGVPVTAVALEWEWEVDDVWSPLTTTEGPAATETIAVALAPYGVARRYRVRAIAVVDGVRLPSAWVTTSTAVTSTDRNAYLVSEDGAEWVRAHVLQAGTPAPIQGVSVAGGLGATSQRVDRTPVAGWRSWHLLEVDALADRQTLFDWLTVRERFYIKSSPELPLTGGLAHVPSVLVAVASEVVPDRKAQKYLSARHVRFDWVTQEGA